MRNLVGQDVWVETPPARLAEAPTHQNVRTDTLYDAEGNAIEQVDPNGIVTHFAYDRQGRLTDVYENYRPGLSATARVNVHTEYIYDASGNRTAIRSANAVLAETQDVISFTYDALGRQLSERDALGNTSTSAYDARWQRVCMTDGLGGRDHLDLRRPGAAHPGPRTLTRFLCKKLALCSTAQGQP